MENVENNKNWLWKGIFTRPPIEDRGNLRDLSVTLTYQSPPAQAVSLEMGSARK